jgi:hypothetical protein
VIGSANFDFWGIEGHFYVMPVSTKPLTRSVRRASGLVLTRNPNRKCSGQTVLSDSDFFRRSISDWDLALLAN